MVHQALINEASTSSVSSPKPNHTNLAKSGSPLVHCACANPSHQQLVDMGANSGLAGSDIHVLHKPMCKINILGIDNHDLSSLDVTATSPLTTNNDKVIGMFHEYDHLGKGSSIHSPSQMEWCKVLVYGKSLKVGGTQHIQRLYGYALPLSMQNGLAHMRSLGPPTDHDI